ncbi:MAG TPA: Lrp/AsnC family transcriptional regulator [Rhizomicrobium sp.]|jgi:Lrp/AsnC family transcriptional regulator|nr:Lrp/AsnC family transcriptional regulator [Rhizomicrobium sp.]
MLDRTDRKLLECLQRDATLSVADLAAAVGLSTTPCWKRVKRLEDEGYILRRVALVDRAKIGLNVTIFVSIRTNEHDPEWLENFARVAASFPEILELYRMSGDVDYLMKVVTQDVEGYDRFYKKLIKAVRLTDVSSAFAMEQIKYSTELPLEDP